MAWAELRMVGLDWLLIGLYSGGLLGVGALFARSNKSSSDMFVAGRASPWWLSGVSAYMTMFSAGTFVVWGGIAYEHGLVGAVICSVYGIAAFIAGLFFAGRWHDTKVSTAAQYVQLRFGREAFRFYTLYRGFYLLVHGLSLYGLSVMLCPLVPLMEGHFLRDAATGNLSVDYACVILSGIIITYTMVGGLWAVLMTDMLQFVVLTVSVVLVIPLILIRAGGWGQVAANTPDGFFQPTAPGFSWIFLVGWMLANCFQLGAEWHFIQRHLCVPTAKDARKAMYLFGWLYLLTPFLWMAPPIIYRSLVADADPKEAYILACQSVLPAGMVGLMVAAMFSATASFQSSVMNMYAGVLTDDVYRRWIHPQATDAQSVRAGRVFTVLTGLYMLAGALILPRFGSYRDVIILVTSLSGASILLPTIWALFSRRIGQSAVWSSILVGIGAGALCKFGFSVDGWFSEIESLTGAAAWVQAHSRESDLLVGISAPCVVLLIAEFFGGDRRNGWNLVEKARDEAIAEEGSRSLASSSSFPKQVLLVTVGMLGLVMLGLTPFAESDWRSLCVMGTVLLLGSLSLSAWMRVQR